MTNFLQKNLFLLIIILASIAVLIWGLISHWGKKTSPFRIIISDPYLPTSPFRIIISDPYLPTSKLLTTPDTFYHWYLELIKNANKYLIICNDYIKLGFKILIYL